MECLWCEEAAAKQTQEVAYWELPDGSRAIEIQNIPSIECTACGMIYQDEKVIEEIEDQMYLIDTSKLEKEVTYKKLMDQPRLLKKNYFKF
jgi:uncharacterized YokU family protein